MIIEDGVRGRDIPAFSLSLLYAIYNIVTINAHCTTVKAHIDEIRNLKTSTMHIG